MFIGRGEELQRLERWWRKDRRLALVWGRRRVGKTALLDRFSQGKRVVFHTGTTAAVASQLQDFARALDQVIPDELLDPDQVRPFRDWGDALRYAARQARDEPLLLVLDEFPELVKADPSLPSQIRAFWDRAEGKTQLKIVLCGSAVRTMFELQTTREPLYGRFDLALQVKQFGPSEVAAMLPGLSGADRATVYGLLGGMPLYLDWWDQEAGLLDNLVELASRPGDRLQLEAELVLATEAGSEGLPGAVLRAIAKGATRFNEIQSAVSANPTRTLTNLAQLQLIESVIPAGQDERSKQKYYRIADNLLNFYLGPLSRFRNEIEIGRGPDIMPQLIAGLPEHLGGAYEEAFRMHLRRLAVAGRIGDRITAIGPWWTRTGQDEIDALVLATPDRTAIPVALGEAKWAKTVDARRIMAKLLPKAQRMTQNDEPDLDFYIAARNAVTGHAPRAFAITAEDIFTTDLADPRPLEE
jgi:AAA+ ATPase superfamily predicted ATPase